MSGIERGGNTGLGPLIVQGIILSFFERFKGERDKVKTRYFELVNKISIFPSMYLEGECLVSANDIDYVRVPCFHVTGPGGGLVAAKWLSINSEEVKFIGSAEERVTIVGVEGIAVKTEKLALEYVDFFIFGDSKFSLYTSEVLSVRDVQLFRMSYSEIEGVPGKELECRASRENVNITCSPRYSGPQKMDRTTSL